MSLQINRPYPLSFFNKASKAFGYKPKIEVDDLIKSARKKTKLKNFNDESFVEPLEILLESINNEARLHNIGLLITRIRLTDILANRLRVEEYIRKSPECLEDEVSPAVLITGLQRTGTTKLHRLLSADPKIRYLRSWEGLNPVPLKKTDNSDRIKAARLSEKALKYIAPDFFAIHPVEHNAPEEEVLLLDMQFLSTVAEATMYVPGYAIWNQNQDQTPAYEYMKRVVKVLQHQRKKPYWVMKSPHHLEFLNIFTKVFPKTSIIHTHRNPVETLASFCSMVFYSRVIFSNHVDPNEVAKHWVKKADIMLRQCLRFRDRNPDSKVIDVWYKDLISDSTQSIQNIYSRLGMQLNEEAKELMKQSESKNKQYKYGKHVYKLEDFGLEKKELENQFSDYIKEFNL
ncbi:MAG: sulfotransferase [Bacteroidota bacterium]